MDINKYISRVLCAVFLGGLFAAQENVFGKGEVGVILVKASDSEIKVLCYGSKNQGLRLPVRNDRDPNKGKSDEVYFGEICSMYGHSLTESERVHSNRKVFIIFNPISWDSVNRGHGQVYSLLDAASRFKLRRNYIIAKKLKDLDKTYNHGIFQQNYVSNHLPPQQNIPAQISSQYAQNPSQMQYQPQQLVDVPQQNIPAQNQSQPGMNPQQQMNPPQMQYQPQQNIPAQIPSQYAQNPSQQMPVNSQCAGYAHHCIGPNQQGSICQQPMFPQQQMNVPQQVPNAVPFQSLPVWISHKGGSHNGNGHKHKNSGSHGNGHKHKNSGSHGNGHHNGNGYRSSQQRK